MIRWATLDARRLHVAGQPAGGFRPPEPGPPPSPTIIALCAAIGLSACGAAAPGPDAAELEEMSGFNFVPRSSATAFIRVFDAVCSGAPEQHEMTARNIGYVPAERPDQQAPRLFVSDDRRPALRMNDDLCLVEAIARTGQTQAARTYVANTHPGAEPMVNVPTDRQVEDMWLLPEGDIIATRRWRDQQNFIRYSLIRYRDDPA